MSPKVMPTNTQSMFSVFLVAEKLIKKKLFHRICLSEIWRTAFNFFSLNTESNCSGSCRCDSIQHCF